MAGVLHIAYHIAVHGPAFTGGEIWLSVVMKRDYVVKRRVVKPLQFVIVMQAKRAGADPVAERQIHLADLLARMHQQGVAGRAHAAEVERVERDRAARGIVVEAHQRQRTVVVGAAAGVAASRQQAERQQHHRREAQQYV